MKPINTIKAIPKENLMIGGTSACQGCGAILGSKLLLKALGKKTIIVNTSGCMTLTALYPFTPYNVPWLHVAIETGGSAATGISMALKALKKDATVVVYGGDGAAYDIGFESLSGLAQRNENVIYVCYNNHAFSNTGFQHASSSPWGSNTTTTPPGKSNPEGNPMKRKDLAKIMVAHGIPYVATACISHPLDYMNKLRKAAEIPGCKFIDLLISCPTGWGFPNSDTITTSKNIVDAGLWPLYEYDGIKKEFRVTVKLRLIPVKDALKSQERYKHLTERQIAEIQKKVSQLWKNLDQGKYFEAEFY
ncbi:MAG: thiamine pyrophosphate-dependent enzyme [Candidatus Aenigmatarchaeota archaeon]